MADGPVIQASYTRVLDRHVTLADIFQMLGTLTAWNRAGAGYSDPPGYLDPVDKTRFDTLDLASLYPFEAVRRWVLEKAGKERR